MPFYFRIHPYFFPSTILLFSPLPIHYQRPSSKLLPFPYIFHFFDHTCLSFLRFPFLFSSVCSTLSPTRLFPFLSSLFSIHPFRSIFAFYLTSLLLPPISLLPPSFSPFPFSPSSLPVICKIATFSCDLICLHKRTQQQHGNGQSAACVAVLCDTN